MAQRNCAFVAIRDSKLRAVGGYRSDFPLLEDWDLWIRLAAAGARFAAIPEPLISVRLTEQAVRRGGWAYARSELRFRRQCQQIGFLSGAEALMIGAAYLPFRLAPPLVRAGLYEFVRASAAKGQPDRVY